MKLRTCRHRFVRPVALATVMAISLGLLSPSPARANDGTVVSLDHWSMQCLQDLRNLGFLSEDQYEKIWPQSQGSWKMTALTRHEVAVWIARTIDEAVTVRTAIRDDPETAASVQTGQDIMLALRLEYKNELARIIGTEMPHSNLEAPRLPPPRLPLSQILQGLHSQPDDK